MAALRAKIIQRMTKINRVINNSHGNCGGKIFLCQPGTIDVTENKANANPINAKGIAKMVCENFIRLK